MRHLNGENGIIKWRVRVAKKTNGAIGANDDIDDPILVNIMSILHLRDCKAAMDQMVLLS